MVKHNWGDLLFQKASLAQTTFSHSTFVGWGQLYDAPKDDTDHPLVDYMRHLVGISSSLEVSKGTRSN